MTGLAFACATDVADGYLARRLGAVSSRGAYLDVTADFLVVLAGFAGFAARGVYPWWLPWIIVLMFAQFIVTSRAGRPVYDPVGKYYGALLFLGIGLTALLEDAAVHELVLAGIVGCTLVSLFTRVRWLAVTRAARAA
jgi:CDP-diacylglycerol--glycerol-3-phosphate 3-phosphatidyltransferase/cardiolipin synthase